MPGKRLRRGERMSPPTLLSLALRSTLVTLESACVVHSPAQLRALLVAQLPATLRQQLLDQVMRSGRLYDTVQLRTMDALFAQDTRHLAIRQVRRWYRTHFAELLSERGSGLHVLLFEDMAWMSAQAQPIACALRSLGNLVQVSLRMVCDDDMLDSLGRSCSHLQELDVSGSARVTDSGVRALCLKSPCKPGAWAAARHLARAACFDCFLDTALDEETALPSRWRASVMRRARKNACCAALRRVNVMGTAVSVRGLQLLAASAVEACVVHEARSREKWDNDFRDFFIARRN